MRASNIDFNNIRELYNALKTLESHNFGGKPQTVTVKKENTKCVSLTFSYGEGVDEVEETKKINSFLLDLGFKSFTLIKAPNKPYLELTTIFKVKKSKK